MVIGNVVEDRAGGSWLPGGPALYSAHMARELGADVTLVSHLTPGYRRTLFTGIDLRAIPADECPRYENTYDAGARIQRLVGEGKVIQSAAMTAAFDRPVDVAILAPAYHELPDVPPLSARVTGVSLQGWLRSTGDGHRVIPHPEPWDQVRHIARPGWFAFLSDEDTADSEGFSRQLAASGVRVLMTCGDDGAALFAGAREARFEAIPPANIVDPTGAGDCFATTFLVRYAETGDEAEAVRFALAAGSLAVEGPGLEGIPMRADVRARAARVAAG